MLKRLLGTKIGMTQLFDEQRNCIPVTVIDMHGWIVTQVKTNETDGYAALQLGLPRKRYRGMPFSVAWLKDKKKFFVHVKEVLLDEDPKGQGSTGYSPGQMMSVKALDACTNVHVAGASRGLGFQGVMKRWGFAGGPGGHGSTFHRSPGAIGNMCSQGKVVKGKKLPGQCGCKRITVKNLKVIKIDEKLNCLFVKGAVPGKKNTLLFIQRG